MFIYPIYVLAPLALAAFIALLSGVIDKKSGLVKYIALAAVVASFAITCGIIAQGSGIYELRWFSFGGIAFNITVSTFLLNKILLFLVGLIGIAIFIYSIGYMDEPENQNRYYFEMIIFTLAMMLFAISANFISLFIAWELLGITSYLLIGFWYAKAKVSEAARAAITTILIGDISMLAAIVLFFNLYHTFNFYTLIGMAPSPLAVFPLTFLLIAVFTKSAQFPFSNWLQLAMEGPTPVSAFLHSSTMVKAGVFILILLLPLFAQSHMLWVLLAVGLITAVFGAMNALSENHVKKILAYSTMEDLGLMIVALGLNAVYAAVALFIVQTFYKALLFLSAGYVMKANHDREDIHKIAVNSRLVSFSMLAAALSLAGLFPLSGFFGKTALGIAARPNILVYTVLLGIDVLSALYIFRWFFVLKKKKKESTTVRFSKLPMELGIGIVLALLIISSLAMYFAVNYREISILRINYTENINDIAIETFLISAGVAAAWLFYRKRDIKALSAMEKNPGIAGRILYNNVFIWSAYLIVAGIIAAAANAVFYFDRAFNRFTYMLGKLALLAGDALSAFENGEVNAYIAVFATGLVFLVIFFIIK